ncbi:5-oxoprolinase subunit PxpA [Salinimicrobium soli]|uniref:5-oxoprolinase subunit PxpA n=1 Tax=Salinimicrobium soli TaxID=1254399 RepID=UPI003AAA4BD0
MKEIHINCDLGEGGKYDKDLMPLISACNIACGGHAGTLDSMHHTVDLAMEHNVEIGAHPSYPDKENFGRKSLQIEAKELHRSIEAQILSLKQIAEAEGTKLTHVKPHGALYNDAQKDEKIAQIILDAILEFDDPLPLYAPKNSVIARLAEGKVKVIFEAFADRNYNTDYSLVSRKDPHALITQKEHVFKHLFSMVSEGKIVCHNGQKIDCDATTFCLHSDTPNSVEILKFLHEKFWAENIRIKHNS